MIFVSDLDQTLIFSKKHIGEGLEDKVLPIEMKNEEIISYIHKEVLEKLRNLNDKLIFIPATTRTLEQYNRVRAFKEYLSPKYAIVNHGGSILVNGELDLKWQNHISDIVSKQCATLNYIKEMFKNKLYNEEWVIDIRQVEDLFLYCILDLEKTPFDKLNSFMSDMRNHNWQACLHGRKLYFIPKPINKWNAVEYLKDMLPDKIIAASGDSYMDFELLEMADYKVLPFHGEVCNKFSPGDTCLRTKTEGLSASLEILEIIESLLKFS